MNYLGFRLFLKVTKSDRAFERKQQFENGPLANGYLAWRVKYIHEIHTHVQIHTHTDERKHAVHSFIKELTNMFVCLCQDTHRAR